MMETIPISVETNESDLTLVVEYDGRKYSYNKKIEDNEELNYLSLRINSVHKMGSVESYLAQEFKLIQ